MSASGAGGIGNGCVCVSGTVGGVDVDDGDRVVQSASANIGACGNGDRTMSRCRRTERSCGRMTRSQSRNTTSPGLES